MPSPHRPLRTVLIAAALLATPPLAGCDATGAGQRVSVAVTVEGGPGSDLPNEHGYRVTLSRASLRLSALRFFGGEPLFSGRRLERLWRAVVGLRRAYAHPGHYQEGEALAELLSPATIDLLAPSTPLGEALGVSGRYRSARLTLGDDPALGGDVRVEGTATKDGEADVVFSASLTLSSEVAGIAAGDVQVSGPTEVRLRVDLARWIERVDFAQLDSGEDRLELPAGGQAQNALTRGVSNTSAYTFSWTTD